MVGWIDSHAHLASDGVFEKFNELKQNAIDNDVRKINIICGRLYEIERILPMIEGDVMFDVSIGAHPSDLNDLEEGEFEKMMAYLTHPQVVCVGEIGLDYYWDDSYKAFQETMLIKQINIANEYNLPIAVHLRNHKENDEAVQDLLRILKEHPVNHKGVIHCYSDSVENAKQFLEWGYYLGFGGITTFKNGQNVRDVLAITPNDRMLLETDTPYLAPEPKRGRKNEPAFVMYVGKYMNNHFGRNTQEQFAQNYYALYTKSKKVL